MGGGAVCWLRAQSWGQTDPGLEPCLCSKGRTGAGAINKVNVSEFPPLYTQDGNTSSCLVKSGGRVN